MNEQLKNQSDLLYTQAKQQFDMIKEAYKNGTLLTESDVIQAAFTAFQEFFATMGTQRFEALTFDDSTPMWSEDYNGMMEDIYLDFETLFREATLLADAMYVDFNHHTVQHDLLTEKLKSIENKLYDLAAYNSIEGYHTNVYAKEQFLNQERIDYDMITMSPLHIEGGNVTMPQKSKTSALEGAGVSIVIGNRANTSIPVGSLSNGYPGNNHEVVTSTKDYDATGKSLALNFNGASNNHANYGAVLDGNPNTWFEYEKVVPTRLVANVSEKDYGFAYKTAGEQYHYWTSELEDGVLRLCLQIQLDGIKNINAIDVDMYVPSNRLAQKAKVSKILVIDENNKSVNVAYEHTGTFFKFNAIKARAIQLFFEQEHAYVTEIGHVFYIKKYIAEDENGVKHSVINRIATANNRVDGPIPSITDIGAIIEENLTDTEVKYPIRYSEDTIFSVDKILNNLSSQIGQEDVSISVERVQAQRYCIGIKDISVFEVEYEDEGELITKPFYFEQPLERITLNIDEADSFNQNWLEYSITIDDCVTWHPIVPLHRQAAGIKTYIIQQVENAKGAMTKEGILEAASPVYSVRLRVIGRKGDMSTRSLVTADPSNSPVLRSAQIQGQVHKGDNELTFISDEEQQFFEVVKPPIPPIEPEPEEIDPVNPPCKICGEEGNTGQEPKDPEDKDDGEDDDVVAKMRTLLESDKYEICLDAMLDSDKVVKITYGASSSTDFPITHFEVSFNHFPDRNEVIKLKKDDAVTKIRKEAVLDLSLLPAGEELIVSIYATNTGGYELSDNISVEISESCDWIDPPAELEGKSKLELAVKQTIGRVCEHTFHESGDLYIIGYVRSWQPIVMYEVYENDSLVASRSFLPEDNIFEMDIPYKITKDLYSVADPIPSPYIIVYDAMGKKKKKSFRLSLRECLEGEASEFLYAQFDTKKTEYCVDDTFIHDWKAGSSKRIAQLRMWLGTKEIYNKVYDISSKAKRASGKIKIPYTKLEIGTHTLKIEIIDREDQVMAEQKDITFAGDCTQDDERRVSKVRVTGKAHKKEYCPCDEDVIVTGEIKVTPGLTRVRFKLGNVIFEPSNLNPLGTMDEKICAAGYPGTGETVTTMALEMPEGLSSIERLEWMAENNQLQTNPTAEDVAFIQAIEEYEIDEKCGCRKKKGTIEAQKKLQAMQARSLDDMPVFGAMITPPVAMVEDISPVITKITDEIYSYEFTLPYWFIYGLGFTRIGKTYKLVIEAENTEEKVGKAEIDIKIGLCGNPDPGPDPNPDPEEPEEPEVPEEECKDDVVQAMIVDYYDVGLKTFVQKKISMLKGQTSATARTVKDSVKNKFIVGVNVEEEMFFIQKSSKGEHPGIIIARVYLEVGPRDLSRTKVVMASGSTTQGEAYNDTALLYIMPADDLPAHGLFQDLINLSDTSNVPQMIQFRSAFIFSATDLNWKAMCKQSHLDHALRDLDEPQDDDEKEEPNCSDHQVVYIQYYDDVNRQLREIYFSLLKGQGEIYNLPLKNGTRDSIQILAGYSGVSKGPAISIYDCDKEEDFLLNLTSIGIGYSQEEGGINLKYAEKVFFTTRTHDNYTKMLGGPKKLEELDWLVGGVPDIDKAPWIGSHSDMVSFSITLPPDACNPDDSSLDDKLPVKDDDILAEEEMEKNQSIKFTLFTLPVYNANIAPGEIESVKITDRVYRPYESYSFHGIGILYTFENGATVTETQMPTDNKGEVIYKTTFGYFNRKQTWRLEFRNMDHYGYGKVKKVEIYPEVYRRKDGSYLKRSYTKHKIELPIESGNRTDTMRFNMISNTATNLLDAICVSAATPQTYDFNVSYRTYDAGKMIEKFGVQIRGAEKIIAEYYTTHSEVQSVNGTYSLLVPAKVTLEDYFFAVPMVQFKGEKFMVPLAEYQLRLRGARC